MEKIFNFSDGDTEYEFYLAKHPEGAEVLACSWSDGTESDTVYSNEVDSLPIDAAEAASFLTAYAWDTVTWEMENWDYWRWTSEASVRGVAIEA